MTNVSLSTVYFNLRGLMFCALMSAFGTQASAQYDLLYENHQQDLGNIPRAVADDGLGNTWLAGNFTESMTLGTITLTNNQLPGQYLGTGFIGKFNSGSNTWLWAKKITLVSNGSGYQPVTNHSQIQDVALDYTGNTYITGSYSGVIKFDHISLSSTKQGKQHTIDIFVAKYNSNGGIVWAKSFGSKIGSDNAWTIALDGSGNIFIGGSFTNVHKTFNQCGGEGGVDVRDVYLAKLNAEGTALWQRRYANTIINCEIHNAANDLSVDASGNVYMVGQFEGTVSFGTGSGLTIASVNGSVDAFAAKINGSGTTQWVKATGGNAYDNGNAVYSDASGNVYAGGNVVPDAFLTKYSPSGTLLWSVNPYPASLEFPSNSIKRINPFSGSMLVNDGLVGFKTISPDDGSVMTSDSLIGNTSSGPQFFIMDTEIAGSGFVFTVMSKCGEVTIGETTLASTNSCPYNGRNIFLVRNGSEVPPPAYQAGGDITHPIATFPEVGQSEIEIYPNPASDQLHVALPEREQETTLIIQNQYGRIVWSEKIDSQRRTTTINLDGQHFQSGIYYLVCISNGEVKTERFVIEK